MPRWLPALKARETSIVCASLVAVVGALILVGASAQAQPSPTQPSLLSMGIISVPLASGGCGKPAPVPPGESIQQSITSGDVHRTYLLHLPPDYESGAELPLVLSFHGHASFAGEQEKRTGLSKLADQEGFVAVYPQGLAGNDHQTGWSTAPRRATEVNDVRFVSDLLNQLQTRLCIDPKRIYATGFSNGGGLTNLLACTMAGRIAAFAPVSGSYPPIPYQGGCHPVRPVSLLEIHGNADAIVPYGGNDRYPPVLLWLDEWAARDGCVNGATTTVQERITEIRWSGCRANAEIVHYRISEQGHVWPGDIFVVPGGTARDTMSASQLIWSFFQKHPLPGPVS